MKHLIMVSKTYKNPDSSVGRALDISPEVMGSNPLQDCFSPKQGVETEILDKIYYTSVCKC